jgi:hypothetical protein
LSKCFIIIILIMTNSYVAKFLLFYGIFVLIIIICVVYINYLQNIIATQDFTSFLLNPLFSYSLIPLLFIAFIFQAWSYYVLAKGKGYSGWLTLLVLVNLIGLIILIVLPSKNKSSKKK